MSEKNRTTSTSRTTAAPRTSAAPRTAAQRPSANVKTGTGEAAKAATRRPAAGTAERPASFNSNTPSRRPASATAAARKPAQPVRKPAANAKKNAKSKAKSGVNVFPIVLVILIIAALAVGAFLLFGTDKNDPGTENQPGAAQTPVPAANENNIGDYKSEFAFAKIEGEDNTLPSSGGYSVKVTDLSVTPGLDEKWMNILMLGTDARTLKEPARTDTMIICSINKETGEVKLASIMRDTNVFFEGHTNGTRINNAFFYGGPQLAMKVVNECFGLNIEKYVCVNFDGFSVIAERLGGIDIVITENEMKHVNNNVMEQYFIMIENGKVDYDVAQKEYYSTVLKKYTTNNDKIHLNGMQALAYARIRKLDSDYARTGRQRLVLNALMEKMKGANSVTLLSLGLECLPYFNTNLGITEIAQIAERVLNRTDFRAVEQMHLPVSGTYNETTRNNDARLYDVDFKANSRALYEFIYK